MNKSEIINIILVSIVLGFCFSFRDWSGIPIFQDYIGFTNLLIACGAVLISLLANEVAYKLMGSRYSAEVKTKTWKASLFLAILSTFITNGYFIFTAIWSVIIKQKELFAHGKPDYFLGPRTRGKIALAGPLINFILGLFSFFMFMQTGSYIMKKLFEINFYLAIFNLFPFFRLIYLAINIPLLKANKIGRNYWQKYVHRSLSGFKSTANPKPDEVFFTSGEGVFFGSRPYWFFFFPLILVSVIMIFLTQQILISLLFAILIAAVVWVTEHFLIEVKVPPES